MAALVLTVVNAGTFAAIAFLFTGLALAPPLWKMRLPRLAAAILFVATPFLLMTAAGLDVQYALTMAFAAAGVVVVTVDREFQGLVKASDTISVPPRWWRSLSSIVFFIALLSGTQPVDFVRGVFIAPAHFSSVFTRTYSSVCGSRCLGSSLPSGSRFLSALPEPERPSGFVRRTVCTCSRCIGDPLLRARSAINSEPFSDWFTAALPLLFLVAIPPVGATEISAHCTSGTGGSCRARRPAGISSLWGPTPVVVAAHPAHGYALSLRRCQSDAPASFGESPRIFLGQLGYCSNRLSYWQVLAWLAWIFAGDVSAEMNSYDANTALTLPGSDMIRLPPSQAHTVEALSQAIRSQCSTFVTLPSMNSLYFWAGESPPTDWFNVWVYTWDRPLQKEIAHRIEGQRPSRFCVVDNPYWFSFWTRGHAYPPNCHFRGWLEDSGGKTALLKDFDGYKLFISHGPAK